MISYVRVFSIAVCAAVAILTPAQAQLFPKLSERELPPSSLEIVPWHNRVIEGVGSAKYIIPNPQPVPSPTATERVRVGVAINAYTSSTVRTNQLGYDYVNDVLSVIFRGGPRDEYPNQGNGSLVINTTTNSGKDWSGNSPVFNAEYPSDIVDMELVARLPNLVAYNDNGTTRITGLWNQFHTTFINPTGLLGTMIFKSGPLNGPYQGTVLDKSNYYEYFPNRIVSDNVGNLYSFCQTIDIDQDALTGEYFLLKSTDKGVTWSMSSQPILREADLEHDYQFFDDAMSLDVSPDGTTLYIGFLSVYVQDGSFTFTENELGYIYSSDGGATWSAPVSYPLYDWTFQNTPANGVDQLEGWMLPSLSVAVDGLNKAHFLMSVYNKEQFIPVDSTLIGEVTVNPADQTQGPVFYALTSNILPDYRRKINPRGATTGPQPTFSIWSEHEWSKSPDGMHLIAKWIDADSIFVTTPDTHPQAFVRDSTHDIFILGKTIANEANENHGWKTRMETIDGQQVEVFDIVNVTKSVGVDEKFTKMSPVFDPNSIDPLTQREKVYFLYTIMATGEFVIGQSYPDTDDQGPAELYMVPARTQSGIEDEINLPSGVSLSQNYPNPFNPATTIAFTVARPGHAVVKVMNLLGQEVGIAFDGEVEAGTHKANFNAANLPSGQYMYRLESNGATVSRMMTLMK